MKKAYRDRALAALAERLESGDFDRRESALFELAVLLRRVNRTTRDDDPLSAAELPRELSRIRLTPGEQRRIADRLIQLSVRRRESRASALWTLGAVAAEAGWEPTLNLLAGCSDQLEGEAAYQACSALRRWLGVGRAFAGAG